jgi:hypothetical protein
MSIMIHILDLIADRRRGRGRGREIKKERE